MGSVWKASLQAGPLLTATHVGEMRGSPSARLEPPLMTQISQQCPQLSPSPHRPPPPPLCLLPVLLYTDVFPGSYLRMHMHSSQSCLVTRALGEALLVLLCRVTKEACPDGFRSRGSVCLCLHTCACLYSIWMRGIWLVISELYAASQVSC